MDRLTYRQMGYLLRDTGQVESLVSRRVATQVPRRWLTPKASAVSLPLFFCLPKVPPPLHSLWGQWLRDPNCGLECLRIRDCAELPEAFPGQKPVGVLGAGLGAVRLSSSARIDSGTPVSSKVPFPHKPGRDMGQHRGAQTPELLPLAWPHGAVRSSSK